VVRKDEYTYIDVLFSSGRERTGNSERSSLQYLQIMLDVDRSKGRRLAMNDR
jgi:hypothetical protein